ncbi:hypothetical protein EOM86_12585, partial [Candidatus Nomurabacteria bacterium]|nr:hypothetical protein [Candidatus Nomurabacteria bacterium]
MESIGGSQRTDGPGSYDPDSLNAEGFDSTVPDDFKLILQNDELSFFYKEATAEFALQEKKSSAVFFSNPQDRDSESFAQGSVKKSIAAQLEISYYKSDGTLAVMDSVNHCIEYNNVSTLKEDHSFTVTYKIGKEKVTINDVPQQMSQERFELFLTKLNEDDASDLKSQYALAILNEGDSDKVKANKREKYKNIDNNPVYYLKYDTDRVLTKVKSYFDAAGYTIDDLIFDFEENMIEGEIVEIPTFVIPLEYSLKGTSLVVGLNTADLEYESSMPIHQIKLLQYFHAGSHEDKGYILVPDGSGSLIYFNNGKTNATPFSMKIYGQDHGSKLLQNNQVDEAARLPVFGIRNGGTSVFAQFEEGESLGGIDAYISRMRTSYNNAYFTIYPVR